LKSCPLAGTAGFVLAGGRSSRMGRDKALVEFEGRTLVSLAAEKLQRAGLDVTIAGARSELAGIAPVIADETPGEGPLGGICTALTSTQAELGVFLPVDLPLLPASLLSYMVRHAHTTGAGVTLVSVNGFAQTFPAVIRTSLWPLLREELQAERRGCFAAFAITAKRMGEQIRAIPVEMLVQAGQVDDDDALPAYRWFLNVNAPDDLKRAGGHRVS